jgi:hypothetical protein
MRFSALSTRSAQACVGYFTKARYMSRQKTQRPVLSNLDVL